MVRNNNTPSKILNRMSKQDIRKMHEEYLKKYPEDKLELDSGIVSLKLIRRVNKFIVEYAKKHSLLVMSNG